MVMKARAAKTLSVAAWHLLCFGCQGKVKNAISQSLRLLQMRAVAAVLNPNQLRLWQHLTELLSIFRLEYLVVTPPYNQALLLH